MKTRSDSATGAISPFFLDKYFSFYFDYILWFTINTTTLPHLKFIHSTITFIFAFHKDNTFHSIFSFLTLSSTSILHSVCFLPGLAREKLSFAPFDVHWLLFNFTFKMQFVTTVLALRYCQRLLFAELTSVQVELQNSIGAEQTMGAHLLTRATIISVRPKLKAYAYIAHHISQAMSS